MERSDGQGRTPTERRVVSLAVALILFVAGLQILLRFEGPRRFLNRSIRLEGEALSQSVEGLEQDAYPWLEWPPPDASEAPSNWATIYLRFLGVLPARAWVLVNGRVAKQLGPEGGSVTVRDGDKLEVYSPDREVSVVVSAATENLRVPAIGTWVVGQGTLGIGIVRLR